MFTLGTILILVGIAIFAMGFLMLMEDTSLDSSSTPFITMIFGGMMVIMFGLGCIFVGLGMAASEFADNCEAQNGIPIEDYTVCIDAVTGAPIHIEQQ